VTKPSNMWLRI